MVEYPLLGNGFLAAGALKAGRGATLSTSVYTECLPCAKCLHSVMGEAVHKPVICFTQCKNAGCKVL